MSPDAFVSSIIFTSDYLGYKHLTSVKVNYVDAPWQSSPLFELEGQTQHPQLVGLENFQKTIPVNSVYQPEPIRAVSACTKHANNNSFAIAPIKFLDSEGTVLSEYDIESTTTSG